MKSAFNKLSNVGQTLIKSAEISNSKFIIDKNILKRVIWAGGMEPVLLKYGQDPRMLKIISQILNVDEFIHLINQAHFKTPGDGVNFLPHQDIKNRDKNDGTWINVDNKGSFVQSMIALDDIDLENGPVYIIENSHLFGKLTEDEIKDLEKTSTKIILQMKAGDVAFWGPYLVHASEANTSSKSRNTLMNGYSQIGANSRIYSGSGTGFKIRKNK